MEILKYQLIDAAFRPWEPVILDCAARLCGFISTPEFDAVHIGSTSFKVGGKGIIDLSLLYSNGQLEMAVQHIQQLGFQEQHSEKPFPSSRPRKDGAVIFNGVRYLLHVHVIEKNSEEHQKQLAYKAYMLANPEARQEYEAAKKAILAKGVNKQDEYGKLKSPFVKSRLAQLS
mgnify:CR=1 FL=1